MSSGDSADAPQISVDQSLLVEAKWMLREGHRTVAALTAMKACEVVVARAVRAKLAELKIAHLYPCLRESVGAFDLRHGNPCHLYESLTGHMIRQEFAETGLWTRFLEALQHQDRVVFEGHDIQRDDAHLVIDVATRFVAMVTRANRL
jgi:hypothetical protein